MTQQCTVTRCFWFDGVVSDVTIQNCVVRHFWFTGLTGHNGEGDKIVNLRLLANNFIHIAGNGVQTGQNQSCLYAFNHFEDVGNGDTGNADWLLYAARRCEDFTLIANTGRNVQGGYKFGLGLNHDNITLIGNQALDINDFGGLILEYDWFEFNNRETTKIQTDAFTFWVDSEVKTFIGDGNTTLPNDVTSSPKWFLRGGKSKTLAAGETITIKKYNGDYYET